VTTGMSPKCVSNFRGWGRISASILFNLCEFTQKCFLSAVRLGMMIPRLTTANGQLCGMIQ
jgi:hypothetical protein